MADWLTFHYPHPDPDTLAWDIYLQDRYKSHSDGVQKGDRVFFYEYKHNPERPRIKYRPGRQGLVRIATVKGPRYGRNITKHYVHGEKRDWSWGVPCDEGDAEGFVSLKDLLTVLDFGSRCVFRGGSGLKKLLPSQGEKVAQLFKR